MPKVMKISELNPANKADIWVVVKGDGEQLYFTTRKAAEDIAAWLA